MSRVTHNRVYLDPAKPFLTYETLIPYLADASGGLHITFTPAGISGGAPVPVFEPPKPGFFTRPDNGVEIPGDLPGTTAPINFHLFAGVQELYPPVLEDPHAAPTTA